MYSGVIIGIILGFVGGALCIRLITKVMLRNLIAAAEVEALAAIAHGAELYHSSRALLDLVAFHVDDEERDRLHLMQQVTAHRYAAWQDRALEHLAAHHPSAMNEGDGSWNDAMTAALKNTAPIRHPEK